MFENEKSSACVSFRNSTFIDQDFILIVASEYNEKMLDEGSVDLWQKLGNFLSPIWNFPSASLRAPGDLLEMVRVVNFRKDEEELTFREDATFPDVIECRDHLISYWRYKLKELISPNQTRNETPLSLTNLLDVSEPNFLTSTMIDNGMMKLSMSAIGEDMSVDEITRMPGLSMRDFSVLPEIPSLSKRPKVPLRIISIENILLEEKKAVKEIRQVIAYFKNEDGLMFSLWEDIWKLF